jgi:ODP family beta-lactamase
LDLSIGPRAAGARRTLLDERRGPEALLKRDSSRILRPEGRVMPETPNDGGTMTASPTLPPPALAFPPLCPTVKVPPTKIADETWVIHQVQPALGQPLEVYLNSMVIRGSEPVIVDTGTPANRAQWLDDVFSIVEPADVKWIFLSHDDVDHTGNLDEALAACPNAKLVCNWAMIERHSNCFEFPLDRCRWVMDGEGFDAGDRMLRAIRPPVFDSPTTRGLYDPRTKVFWSVDTFATPLPDWKISIADLDPHFWDFGLMLFALGAVSPWISMCDPVKYGKHVDKTQSLDITTIAACHSPVIEGPFIDKAFERIRQLPTLDPPDLPDQSILDEIIAATAHAPE